jgi:hypothetical protein
LLLLYLCCVVLRLFQQINELIQFN